MQQEPLVNPFAAKHGSYAHEPLPVTAGELGEGKAGQVRVLRNRGGTTVERWLNSGSLDRRQAEAISMYQRAWRLTIGEQRVTMNWSLTSTIRGVDASAWADDKASAEGLLDDMRQSVFRTFPRHYFEVWQNVVIFDQSAGVAGAALGYRNSGAETAAKTIVLFVADMIATAYRL